MMQNDITLLSLKKICFPMNYIGLYESLVYEDIYSHDTKVNNEYDCCKPEAVKLYDLYCTKCIIKNVNMTES